MPTVGAGRLWGRAGAGRRLPAGASSPRIQRDVTRGRGSLLLGRGRAPARDEGDPLRDQLLQVVLNHLLALKGKTLVREKGSSRASKAQEVPQDRWLMLLRINRGEDSPFSPKILSEV